MAYSIMSGPARGVPYTADMLLALVISTDFVAEGENHVRFANMGSDQLSGSSRDERWPSDLF